MSGTAKEPLFDCPTCGRQNFTERGLKAHVCRPTELSTTIVTHEGDALSMPQQRRLLDDSERLIHHGNLREWQGLLMRAAGLWNIKTKKLFVAREFTSFDEYTDTIQIGDRQRRRYAQIGQSMFLMARQKFGDNIDPLTFTFTTKLLTETFEGYFTNGHAITIEGLAKASNSLDQFKAYLNGDGGDGSADKLLHENNVVSDARKQLDAPLNPAKDFHAHMREIAKEKGLRWNKEKFQFENIDGTALRDDQKIELTTRERGLEIWHATFKEIRATKKRIASHAALLGDSYLLYDRVPDTNFQTTVTEIARSIENEIESYSEVLDALLAKDFARIKELATVRADEEVQA